MRITYRIGSLTRRFNQDIHKLVDLIADELFLHVILGVPLNFSEPLPFFKRNSLKSARHIQSPVDSRGIARKSSLELFGRSFCVGSKLCQCVAKFDWEGLLKKARFLPSDDFGSPGTNTDNTGNLCI